MKTKSSITVNTQQKSHSAVLSEGIRDGIPIALGYLAVSFALGIAAKKIGLNAFQGFLVSLLNNASAGEYAGFQTIAKDAPYWEMALITLITNARYLLMSCALSQKFKPETPIFHRLLVGFDVTDEIFGISVARPGALDPYYNYGAMMVALPGWSVGTFLGVIAGNLLPARFVSALGVALYGMFLAVIIPPARKNPVVAGLVMISFAASYAIRLFTLPKWITDGMIVILLTVILSAAAAIIFPVKDEPADASAEGEASV